MRVSHKCCTLIIDLQENLIPILKKKDRLLKNSVFLIKGLGILGIPGIVTEQYPKGLGPTVSSIKDAAWKNFYSNSGTQNFLPLEKTEFSCCSNIPIMEKIKSYDSEFVIIAGAETHVCVLQTAEDLLYHNYTPVIVADCTSSSRRYEKRIALSRLLSHGAIVTTAESLLFELCGKAGTPQFKTISSLVKERN
jgi:hypothetical protein